MEDFEEYLLYGDDIEIMNETLTVPCFDCGDEVIVDEEAEVSVILCDACGIDFETINGLLVPNYQYVDY